MEVLRLLWRRRAAALSMLLWPAIAFAQAGGGYDLSWSTIDAGGATFSTGGTYRLGGTAGQPDAGALAGGTYELAGGFWNGGGGVIGITSPEPATPLVFRLHPASPNPFRGRTRIAFDLPAADRVRLSVYDAGGKLVRGLVDEERVAGKHELAWEGTDAAGRGVARGIYFLRIVAGETAASRKLILLGR